MRRTLVLLYLYSAKATIADLNYDKYNILKSYNGNKTKTTDKTRLAACSIVHAAVYGIRITGGYVNRYVTFGQS